MTDRFDTLLAQIAQQHGGVEPLLDTFFGFLHRKTDFYVVSNDPSSHRMGFLPGQAQQKVLSAFQKYPMKRLPDKARTRVQDNVSSKKNDSTSKCSHIAVNEEIQPQLTEDGKQVPVGNGGRSKNYVWTQTLEDVTIHMELPQGTKAKDLDCRIESTKIQVTLKSDPRTSLLNGEFVEKIRVDESIWSVESNHMLNISLEKIKPTWWASAIKGDPEIDTSQVDSQRNIQDYDEVTQGAIRKAVYDQRLQQLNGGQPLTPEEQMLQEAKALPGSPFLPRT
ncbi:Nuclear distribution protein NUDC [Plasmopara halstedii]|uniref:Nuclear distribution protein NUDC n=1 Tax=Plasmopara halstedii TaxID=4781 RepID=A0A0N7L481_PLAHL|nr:Nuclear distribution protein NUDC [Plasmopara halstedii]CEG37939.1 Nuclear distribution protein NUDC [Plasmopara halstedii]|eukprot:XP_024574308.1 Nuclear distribution protein NUDC [Plasmopara halstedii]